MASWITGVVVFGLQGMSWHAGNDVDCDLVPRWGLDRIVQAPSQRSDVSLPQTCSASMKWLKFVGISLSVLQRKGRLLASHDFNQEILYRMK
jgi:hypothetical protein